MLCREVVRLSDGGHICLDWYCEGSQEQPTILMLPGITGIELISSGCGYYYIDMDIPASNIGLQKSADTNQRTTSLVSS